jgi:hypothetical protein
VPRTNARTRQRPAQRSAPEFQDPQLVTGYGKAQRQRGIHQQQTEPETIERRPLVHGIVNAPTGGATLHEQPLAHTKVVTPLKNGDRLEIDRIEGDWLHATTDDKKSGFVHKSKVRINP